MRHHRMPVVGPRAAGVVLIIAGMTAFILLALLSPVSPATHNPGRENVTSLVSSPDGADAVYTSDPGTTQDASLWFDHGAR